MRPLEPAASRRRPSRRRRFPFRAIAIVLAVAAAFVLGLGVGRALEDGPEAGRTETSVRTLRPLPLPPAARTVTVTTAP